LDRPPIYDTRSTNRITKKKLSQQRSKHDPRKGKKKNVILIHKKKRESKAGTFLYNKTTKSPSASSATQKSQKGNSISIKEIHFGSLSLLKSKPDQV
jgi:hypothetical protein